jgi:pilus assembly protein Flp/PilA
MSLLSLFINDEVGATAIEYGLIASMIAIAGIVAFTALGDTINATFADISDDFCVAVGGEFSLSDEGSDSCSFQ